MRYDATSERNLISISYNNHEILIRITNNAVTSTHERDQVNRQILLRNNAETGFQCRDSVRSVAIEADENGVGIAKISL